MERDLLRRIDVAASTLNPPITFTRSDVIRIMLHRALDAHEGNLPPSRPQPDGDVEGAP